MHESQADDGRCRRRSQEMASKGADDCDLAPLDGQLCYHDTEHDTLIERPGHPEFGVRVACFIHAVLYLILRDDVRVMPIEPGSAIAVFNAAVDRRAESDRGDFRSNGPSRRYWP